MTVIIDDEVTLPPLLPATATFVADPALADSVEMEYDIVAPASPTSGPNRMTLHVPTESTVLSIGAPSAQWHTDKGITGYTAHHIHFETKQNHKTIVSLGEPATTAAIQGYAPGPAEAGQEEPHEEGSEASGSEEAAVEEDQGEEAEQEEAAPPEGGGAGEEEHEDEGAGTAGAAVPTASRGYAMVTADRAWQEATGQHYLLSRKKDISIRTPAGEKRAVVQADAGHVDLNGGEEVNLSGRGVAIGAAAGLHLEDVHCDAVYTGSAPSSAAAATGKTWLDRAGALASAHDLFTKAKKTVPKWDGGKLAKTEAFWVDVVKWGSDLFKFGRSMAKMFHLFGMKSVPENCVKIGAQGSVTGIGGADVSLTGTLGASMGSLVATTVGAGAMATLKGTLFAGVGGTFTSMKAIKRAESSSTWGDMVISAKKDVEMSSDENLIISAHDTVQVASKNKVVLGGGESAWIGNEHFGMMFNDEGVSFGKAKAVQDLDAAGVEATPSIHIEKDKIEMAVASNSKVSLADASFKIEAPKILLDAKVKHVQFNGDSILKFG